MVDVLSDVFLESFRVCQKFVEELARYLLLNAMILGDDTRVEVLPEQPAVTTPMLAVWHEAEVKLPTYPIDTPECQLQLSRAGPRDLQVEHR